MLSRFCEHAGADLAASVTLRQFSHVTIDPLCNKREPNQFLSDSSVMNLLETILSDHYAIWWFEGLLGFLVICGVLPILRWFLQRALTLAVIGALILTNKKGRAGLGSISTVSATLSLKHADAFWGYLVAVYGVFWVVVFTIPLEVETAKHYRIILSVLNVVAALYLCFINGWFRTKGIRLIERLRNLPD
jgi:DNA integrity scanning protein DisA with diadenylate cyclase activity